jgi:hypothetical protein
MTMPKIGALSIAFVLVAAPALAQESIVAKHRVKFGTPLTTEQTVALLRAVASEVGGGILRKPSGHSCLGYSCDVICFASGQQVDVLIDSEGAANPAWQPVANPNPQGGCELVPPAVIVVPPPNPILNPWPLPPLQACDLTFVNMKLDAIMATATATHTEVKEHRSGLWKILGHAMKYIGPAAGGAVAVIMAK